MPGWAHCYYFNRPRLEQCNGFKAPLAKRALPCALKSIKVAEHLVLILLLSCSNLVLSCFLALFISYVISIISSLILMHCAGTTACINQEYWPLSASDFAALLAISTDLTNCANSALVSTCLPSTCGSISQGENTDRIADYRLRSMRTCRTIHCIMHPISRRCANDHHLLLMCPVIW